MLNDILALRSCHRPRIDRAAKPMPYMLVRSIETDDHVCSNHWRRGMTRITKRRMADDNHAVITVAGGGHRYRRHPCARCPWRVDAVGEFPAEAFRLSANTGADGSKILTIGFEEASHTFGCHDSGSAKPATCAGYILRGDDGIGWRLAVMTGRFDPKRVRTDVPLFASYYDMAVANGVPPDDPALDACRPWRLDHV